MASVLAIDIVIVCHSHPEKNAATHLNYDYPVAGIFRVIGVSTSFRVSLIFMGYFTFPMALWVAIRWWNKAGWVKDWWSVWLGTSGPSHMANCWFQLRLQLHLRNHPPSYRHHLQPHLSVSATHVVPSNTWSPPTTAAQKKVHLYSPGVLHSVLQPGAIQTWFNLCLEKGLPLLLGFSWGSVPLCLDHRIERCINNSNLRPNVKCVVPVILKSPKLSWGAQVKRTTCVNIERCPVAVHLWQDNVCFSRCLSWWTVHHAAIVMFPFSTLVLTDMGSSWLIFHLRGLVAEGWIANVVIFHVPQYKTGWFNSSTLGCKNIWFWGPSVSIYGIPPGEYLLQFTSQESTESSNLGDLHPTDLRFVWKSDAINTSQHYHLSFPVPKMAELGGSPFSPHGSHWNSQSNGPNFVAQISSRRRAPGFPAGRPHHGLVKTLLHNILWLLWYIMVYIGTSHMYIYIYVCM
jgi:hypothetical protein